MLKSFGLIVIFSVISYFHIHQLAKDKLRREIWIFTFLMLFITGIGIAQVNHLPIPNPLELISITMEPVNKMFAKNIK
ncbi:hypothetical protein ACWM35_17235 [Neobacillus sp. K501]